MTRDKTAFEERTPTSAGSARRIRYGRRPSFFRRLFVLRNWRVRRRLMAVVLIPVIAAVALGGFRIAAAWDSARNFERAEQLAELGEKITALTHELQQERDLMAGHVARGRSGEFPRINEQKNQVSEAAAGVRQQLQHIDDSYSGIVREKATAVQNRLSNLSAVRNAAVQTKLPPTGVIDAYSDIIQVLLDFTVEISQSSENGQLSERVRALSSFAHAKEQTSRQRALLYVAMERGSFDSSLHESYLLANAREGSALGDYEETASVRGRQLFEDTVTGTEVDQAARMEARALARAESSGGPAKLTTDAAAWFDAMTAKLDMMREVESQLAANILSTSQSLQEDARVSAVRDIGIVLLVILLALTIALTVARSMARPLQRLRTSALDVAEFRLPDVVHRLQQSDGRNVDVHIEHTGIDSDDEIGQMARAFDQVQDEAVRMASEQAALRGNVNAMFVNLSRRSQGLVERQLRLIDELETSEQDPDQLSSLFKLDHLATRMRRHGENLLVLAGEEPGRRWGQPIPLVDVLRAGVSEVEQYERIELRGTPNAEIVGRAVNDLVHLLAELLENATSYSSRDTKVVINSEILADGRVMLEVTDNGIGMSADELNAVNERLGTQPVVDVSVSRRMGLFVVGRLAWRHGIRVQLRSSEAGGVSALIMLAEDLVTLANASATSPGFPQIPDASGPLPAVTSTGPMPAADGPAPEWHGTGNGASGAGAYAQPTGAQPADEDRPGAATSSWDDLRDQAQQGSPPSPHQEHPDTPWSPEETRHPQEEQPTAAWPALQQSQQHWSQQGPEQAPQQPQQQPTGSSPQRGQPAPDSAEQPTMSWPRQSGVGQPYVQHPVTEPGMPAARSGDQSWNRRQATTNPNMSPVPAGSNGSMAPPHAEPHAEPRANVADTGHIFGGSDSSLNEERKQSLPIFDAIESEWFRNRGGSARPPSTTAGNSSQAAAQREWPSETPQQQQRSPVTEGESWASPGDDAWRAAERTISAPASSGTTGSGLPKRVPGRNFVPGSAGEAGFGEGARPAARSPEAVGGRLASYHRGIQQGRDVGRESGDEPEPLTTSQREQENA